MTKSKHDPQAIIRRQNERKRKRIRTMKIRRTVFFSTIACIIIYIILFHTPLFKIRSIDVQGNSKIEASEILTRIGDVENKNLFRAKISSMKKELLKIPYVKTVDIDRVVFKSKLSVNIEECAEAASISGDAGFVIIDKNAKVLSETAEKPTGVPEIIGLSATNIALGEKLKIGDKDKERFDIVLFCLNEMSRHEILNGVTNISVADIGNITFNYENRLDAICGSNVDLQKKIGFFKSALSSPQLTENSRGTIDLTNSGEGKAIYTP